MTETPSAPTWLSRLRYPHLRHAKKLWNQCDGQVQSGPFQGMRLTGQTTGALLPPYLLGSFESALHPFIDSLGARPPSCVVNVGAGDGYYAAGFATLWPNCRVLAFDPLAAAHANTHQWAASAGVQDRIELLDAATPPALEKYLSALPPNDALIWCDCEGAEADLADPETVPSWCLHPFAIELHPWIVPDIQQDLTERFTPSHHLTIVNEIPIVPSEFPILQTWPPSLQQTLLNEGRDHPGRWLLGTPNREGTS